MLKAVFRRAVLISKTMSKEFLSKLIKWRKSSGYFQCLSHHTLHHIILMMFLLFCSSFFISYIKFTSLKTRTKHLKVKSLSKSAYAYVMDETNLTISNIMNRRWFNINKSCENQKKGILLNRTLEHTPWMYVSPEYKFLYCQIPKVASTNWMKLMIELSKKITFNKTKSVHRHPIPMSLHFKPKVMTRLLKTYKKFVVVRDPFKRALSAYKDKFMPIRKGRNLTKFKRLTKFITQYYRPASSENKNFYPSFDEFISYITDTSKLVRKSNAHYSEPRHWMPQTELCSLCQVNYDYVLNFDNMTAESKYLFEKLGIPPNFTLSPPKHLLPSVTKPVTNETYANFDQKTMQFFEDVSAKNIHALYQYYEKDYKIFGFKTPSLIKLLNLTDVV